MSITSTVRRKRYQVARFGSVLVGVTVLMLTLRATPLSASGLHSSTSQRHFSPTRVSGSLHFSFYTPGKTVLTNQESCFEITIEPGKWMLRTSFGTNLSDLHYWQFQFDGTNSVGEYVDSAAYYYDGKSFVPVATNILRPVLVYGAPYPVNDYTVQIPWLAFSPSECLDEDFPAPWMIINHEPRAHAFTARISRFDEPPFVPRDVLFITSEKRARTASKSAILRLEGLARSDRTTMNEPVSLPDGLLEGEYHVLDTTNLNGFKLPTQFEFRSYYAPVLVSGPSTNRLLALLARGELRSFCFTDPIPVPARYTNASVTDYRFRDSRRRIDNIVYFITNAPIATVSAPDLQALFSQKKKSAKFFYPDEIRVAVIWGLFALLFLVPLLAAVFARWKRKRKNKTN